MTPKDKAKQLFDKYYETIDHNDNYWGVDDEAKDCAILAVDELINYCKELSIQDSGSVFRDLGHIYWQEVKEEINKL